MKSIVKLLKIASHKGHEPGDRRSRVVLLKRGFLACVGYWVGNNQALVHRYMHTASYVLIAVCVALASGYVIHRRRKSPKSKTANHRPL